MLTMKKLCSLLLATMMILTSLCLVASAGDAAATAYTNPTDGYQISYPADWMLMDKASIDGILEQVAAGTVEGMDASVLAPYKAQIDAMDMVLVMSKDGLFNFNIIYQALPMEVTNDLLISQMLPASFAQLEAAFAGMTTVDAGSIVTVGDKEFAHMAIDYTLNEIPMNLEQYYYLAGKTLYIFSFTRSATGAGAELDMPATVTGILETFVPVVK